jgi:hypothetical protein
VAVASPAVPALVDPRGFLHSSARRSVDVEHWERLLRGVPVTVVDVAVGGWPCEAGSGVAGGADVSGAPGLGAGRRVLAGMGNRWRLWPEVTA